MLTAALALALLAAAPADAERRILEKAGWTYIGLSDDVLVYMKRDDKPVDGALRRVLTLYETLSPRERMGFTFRSVRSLSEYDCKSATSRVIGETFFAQPALKGQTWVQPDFKPTPWAEAAEGSIGALRYSFACGRV